MKKIFCLLLFILFLFPNVQAQLEGIPGHSMTLIPLKSASMKEVEGSPYFENDQFQPGILKMNDIELEVFLRYNVVQERIEIKVNIGEKEIYELPPRKDIIYIYGNKEYVINKFNYEGDEIYGYFIRYYEGDEVSLFGKPTVEITEAVKARTGYQSDEPARIDIDKEYYIVQDNNKVYNVRLKHRDVKKEFRTEEAQKYLRDNKIKSEADLIDFVSFLDEQ